MSRIVLAVRVALWLGVLPLRWHTSTLPSVMRKVGAAKVSRFVAAHQLDVLVRIVRRVTRLRCFGVALFPRQCLRDSLTLYHVLTQAGHPAQLCVGVRIADAGSGQMAAHSWVRLHGAPVVPGDDGFGFRLMYVHPETPVHVDGTSSAGFPQLSRTEAHS